MSYRVKVRERKKNKGAMLSLYLEFMPPYVAPNGECVRYENLNLELYVNPANEIQEKHNRMINEIAETIRCERYITLVQKDYIALSKDKLSGDFIEYFHNNCKYYGIKFECSLRHFRKYSNNKCQFKDIIPSYCEGFKNYLLRHKCLHHQKKLAKNTAAAYFSAFLNIVSLAYKDGILSTNVAANVKTITWKHGDSKEYLTESEIKRLEKVKFDIFPEVKQASLFAIYTGLRRSDVLTLDWRNLHLRSKKNAYMTLIIHKTQNKVRLPLSESAVKILGKPLKEGVVFNGLTEHALNKYVPMLIKTAGISKHITFHRFRDTFAMRLLDNGVDIYTIATLLGHKQVSSTQIYVRLSPQKARKALMKLK